MMSWVCSFLVASHGSSGGQYIYSNLYLFQNRSRLQ
jgi:cAMP phosphodiesterase